LAKETRADDLRFRKARQGERKSGKWKPSIDLRFAIKAAPRSQRSPSAPASEERAPRLSLIERNLANAGFSSFVPTLIVRFHCSDLAVYTCDQ